jgi:dipeptidyl aminopeptidase/acylaminoacyl peptidase
MDADGSNQTNLTNHSSIDSDPAWSPDGNQIAFRSDRDGNAEIYVMNADGSNQTRLTNHFRDDFSPTWSPDGTQIAFSSNRNGITGGIGIYVMDADGSNVHILVVEYVPSISRNLSAAWSPDGTQIAFETNRDGNREIYVVDADGTGLTNLTNHSNNDFSPAWSPDGTQIAFHSGRDGNYEIFVMDADGSNPTNLTNHDSYDSFPVWSLAQVDTDNDGVPDADDNCTNAPNPAQDDTDGDDCGNVCDADYDQTGSTGFSDYGAFINAFGTFDLDFDHTEPVTGPAGFGDVGAFNSLFGSAPGPSGTTSGTIACP